MARKKKVICSVDGCDDEVHCLDVCIACYQRMRYWNDRPLRDKVRHLKRMNRCRASLEMMTGNVRPITSARRKRA